MLKYPIRNFISLTTILVGFTLFFNPVCYSQPIELNKESSSAEIVLFLQKTEDISLTDSVQFSKNLKSFKQLGLALNNNDHCFYDYLVSYEIGYGGGFKISKQKLENLFKNCKDKLLKIKIKSILSIIDVIARNYISAINNLNYMVRNIDKIHNKKVKHIVYATASQVYRLVDQNDLSLNFSELLINDNPSDLILCKVLSGKYRVLLKLEDKTELAPKIQNEIKNSMQLCKDAGDYIYGNLLNIDWLNYQLHQQDIDNERIKSIIQSLNDSSQEINNTQFKNIIGIRDSLFAKAYWKLKKHKIANDFALLTLENSKSIGSTAQKLEALEILIDYNHLIGGFEQALYYSRQKSASEKIHYDDNQAKVMAYQTVMHENVAKTHQIDFLNEKNKVLSLENELADKAALVQDLVILSLGILAFFIVLWGIRHKKIQKLYKDLSERDHMTLIYNRKGLKDYMDEILPKSKQNNQEICYAIFDLDLFKNVNDTYGHITGDWVIKNVIKSCQKIQDKKITLGRLGGEEFAIVRNDSTLDELYRYCEKCRLMIESIDTNDSGYDFNISASFGVTSTRLSGLTYTTLLTHADEALYKAKHKGRNNTVIYQAN